MGKLFAFILFFFYVSITKLKMLIKEKLIDNY